MPKTDWYGARRPCPERETPQDRRRRRLPGQAADAPKTSATAKTFADFPAAFDYCRETNKPATVIVKGETWRVFPSGRAERVAAAQPS